MSVRCTRTPDIRNSTILSVSDLVLKTPAAQVAQPAATGVRRVPVPPVDIVADRVTKGFGETPVFADVSFRLARGEAVAIVGANGTGKSTLLRCIMGLIPVTAGQVTLLGQEVTEASAGEMRAIRARIGLVSQRHNLVPRLSVLSNVVQGLLGRHPGPRYWSHMLAPTAAREAAMAGKDERLIVPATALDVPAAISVRRSTLVSFMPTPPSSSRHVI